MWLTTQWKLRRALCRYRRDGDVDAVLGAPCGNDADPAAAVVEGWRIRRDL